jgi:hypothetical protein
MRTDWQQRVQSFSHCGECPAKGKMHIRRLNFHDDVNEFLSHMINHEDINYPEMALPSEISKFLGLNWRTVKRLLSTNDDRDDEQYLQSTTKNKVLDPYESFVKSRLELYR